MTLPVVAAFALWFSLSVLSGLVAGRALWRRALSLLLAVATTLIPFTISSEYTIWRGLLGLGSVLAVFRAIDLSVDEREHSAPLRAGLMLSLVDLREVRAAESRLELRRMLIGLLCIALALGSYGLTLLVEVLAVRWLLGAVFVYMLAEASSQFMTFAWHAAGYRIPLQHRAPIVSSSVSEFWSRRWNLNVRNWLYQNCYRPLARRKRPVLGVVAAFAASTLLHFWFIAVALGVLWGLVMASFFVVQGAALLVESKLALRRWPKPLRHAWTIAAVALPSPLFVEPWLRLFE